MSFVPLPPLLIFPFRWNLSPPLLLLLSEQKINATAAYPKPRTLAFPVLRPERKYSSPGVTGNTFPKVGRIVQT